MTAERSKRKLLLIGWAGADWSLITPLLEAGQMPHIAALIERGVMGNLSSLVPLISPSLWTSVATGKRPDKHGVLIGTALDHELGVLQPISRAARRTSTFWNILDQQGLTGHVINWPASHPAETLKGAVVSDAYPRVVAPLGDQWPLDPSTITPPRLEAALKDLRMHPGELDANDLRAFVAQLEKVDQRDRRVDVVAQILAETASVHAAATSLLDSEPWDFLAVHYGGLERLAHHFLRYQPPRLPGCSEVDCDLYGDVVPAAYRFYDSMLGRLLELAGDEVTVMLVSDHGFRTGELRPRQAADNPVRWHRGQGVFCFAGAGVLEDELIHQASILDITPTILVLFDLPVGGDMDGQPLLAAWQQPPVPDVIASWDHLVRPEDAVAPSASPSFEEDEALAELKSLGYADHRPAGFEQLAGAVRRLETYTLAMSHLHCARYRLALELLQALLDEEPDNQLLRLQTAYCCYHLDDYDASRRLLDGFAEDTGVSKEKALLSAMILVAEHRSHEALAALEVAKQTDRREPLIHCFVGRAYLQLKQHGEAEEAFNQALSIDRECLDAHFGLTLAFVDRQRWAEAVDSALAVVRLDHHQSGAHYLLGLSLFRLNRPEWALQAFETAIAVRPGWMPPQKWAVTLRGFLSRQPVAIGP